MIAISAGSSANSSMPPASMQGHQAERLDRGAQGHEPVGVAELADEPAVRVGFDDVAAVDALLDPVAHLADEDRGLGPGAAGRARNARLRSWCRGGHVARIPRYPWRDVDRRARDARQTPDMVTPGTTWMPGVTVAVG